MNISTLHYFNYLKNIETNIAKCLNVVWNAVIVILVSFQNKQVKKK